MGGAHVRETEISLEHLERERGWGWEKQSTREPSSQGKWGYLQRVTSPRSLECTEGLLAIDGQTSMSDCVSCSCSGCGWHRNRHVSFLSGRNRGPGITMLHTKPSSFPADDAPSCVVVCGALRQDVQRKLLSWSRQKQAFWDQGMLEFAS